MKPLLSSELMKTTRRLRPTAGNVFIRPDKDPSKEGLIWKPEAYANREMPQTGVVVAIGGKLKTKKGVLVDPEFKVGQRVVFRKFSGLFTDFEGEQLVQLKQHHVEAILE